MSTLWTSLVLNFVSCILTKFQMAAGNIQALMTINRWLFLFIWKCCLSLKLCVFCVGISKILNIKQPWLTPISKVIIKEWCYFRLLQQSCPKQQPVKVNRLFIFFSLTTLPDAFCFNVLKMKWFKTSEQILILHLRF